MCGPKLMCCCPRDGLVATFCLSSTSNKLRPNHPEGMLMCGAPGTHIEMPICGRGQLGARGENETLTPGPLSAWRGDRGGERPLQPGSALCFGSVSLQVCQEGCGEKGNASLHHVFSLWLRMWTPVGFKSKIKKFSNSKWVFVFVCFQRNLHGRDDFHSGLPRQKLHQKEQRKENWKVN